jgi:hypothetical protein
MYTDRHNKFKFDENSCENLRTGAQRILTLYLALFAGLFLAVHFQTVCAIVSVLLAPLIAWNSFVDRLWAALPMIVIIFFLLLGFALAILITAHLEYLTHRFLMHDQHCKQEWRKKFSQDHIIHHTVYGEHHYDHPIEKFADISPQHKGKPLMFFGLTSCTKYPMTMGVPFLIVGLLLHWWSFCWCLFPMLCFYTPFFNLFHVCTHQSWKPTYIPDFPYWQICYQHLLHHNHFRKETHGNYGVMFGPLCDIFYGTHVAASDEDEDDWQAFRKKVRSSIVPAKRKLAQEKC